MKPAFTLSSPETGTEYWIYVVAPDVAKTPGPWTVMLFLDADGQFPAGVAAYHELPSSARMPPLLLVGVGYGASYGEPANKRGRDYTPTHHRDEPSSGGARAFHEFLIETLWPELARRHPVSTEARGVGGHSLSSLFVLFALFQPQPFFTHFLASAPSIWWDDRSILQQAARFRTGTRVLPARLFLGAGCEDSTSMLGDLALLESQLATRPFAGLQIASQRFPGRNHYNVLPQSFAAGLTSLFGAGPLNPPAPTPGRRPPRRPRSGSPRGGSAG